MKKISLVDTFAVGTFHEIFNSAFLVSVMVSYDYIQYWGTKSSIENQKNVLSKHNISNISYCEVWNICTSGLIGLLCRYIIAAINCIRIIRRLDVDSKIILMNNNPFLTLLYPLINRDVNIICHGEMELLEGKDNGKLAKFMTFLLKRAYLNKSLNPNLHFFVLGDSVLRNLKEIVPLENYSHFASFDHPYIFKDINYDQIKTLKYPLKIGVVSITTPSKGKTYLKQLLLSKSENVDIFHIGKIVDTGNELRDLGLKIVKRNENNELKREEYESWIRKMDFILFLYPTDNYRLTASGAIFECMSLGIPTISLRNDYFDYLRSKIGDFGLFFNSYDELSDTLKVLPINDVLLCRYRESIIKGRELFSPYYVGQTLSQKLY